jgi:hypothetical protein
MYNITARDIACVYHMVLTLDIVLCQLNLEEPGGLPSPTRINLEEPGGLPSPTRINLFLCLSFHLSVHKAKGGIWSKRVFMRTNGNFSFGMH